MSFLLNSVDELEKEDELPCPSTRSDMTDLVTKSRKLSTEVWGASTSFKNICLLALRRFLANPASSWRSLREYLAVAGILFVFLLLEYAMMVSQKVL